jgi:ketosteroid isomerase-like protein
MAERQSMLAEYYARLDSDEPGDALRLLADDFSFAIDLCGTEVPGGYAHYSGGREDIGSYVFGRPAGRRHYLLELSVDGGVEMALGRVTQDGDHLAMFMAAIETNDGGQITKYLVTRSSALVLG